MQIAIEFIIIFIISLLFLFGLNHSLIGKIPFFDTTLSKAKCPSPLALIYPPNTMISFLLVLLPDSSTFLENKTKRSVFFFFKV